MPIAFDRSVCCDLNETISREWLLTNGLGGYASGTVSGTLTRLEQGLLVASPQEGTQPQLLVAKLDEEIVFDQRTYYLGTNEYKDGTLNPAGFVHLETFRLEEGFPVFTYHLGGVDGIVLEKRIWMPERLNTTYIQYRVLRTNSPQDITPWNNRKSRPAYTRVHDAQRVLSLTLLPLAAYRPSNEAHHADHDRQFQVEAHHAEQDDDSGEVNDSIAGCTIRAGGDARPYHIFAVGHPESQSTFLPTGVWYWNFLHREDEAAGRTANDDLYLPGVFRTRLWPGEDVSLTIIITAEELSRQTFSVKHLIHAYDEAVDYQRNILQTQRYFGEGGAAVSTHPTLPFPEKNDDLPQGEEFLRLLTQAGNRFLVERPVARDDAAGGHSFFFPHMQNIPVVIPGYYSAQESTRDMLIALPGLLLTTHKYAEARRILSELGRHFKQGLLPDRLPAPRENDGRATTWERSYGGIDTTLWYFYSLDHYTQATRDYELLDSLASNLEECIDLYIRGTLNGTGVDAQDGLLRTQVHTDDERATTRERTHGRQGKAVEINALWYLALSLMHEWSEQGAINRTHLTLRQGKAAEVYEERRRQCRRSFNERFWYALGGYLYDVIDGPDGDDASIRPNQLFALSLRYPVLDESHRRSVLNIVTQHLLTPHGLRALSPLRGGDAIDRWHMDHIKQHQEEQQSTLHQGSAWPWLIGPYVDALLRVEGSAPVWRKGIQLLDSFREQLRCGMLGMIGSVYDGDTTDAINLAPTRSHIQLASALSIGELLRVYKLLAHLGVRSSDQALSV